MVLYNLRRRSTELDVSLFNLIINHCRIEHEKIDAKDNIDQTFN